MRCKNFTTLVLVFVVAASALFMPTKRAEAFFGCTPVITPPAPLGIFVPTYDIATAVQMSVSNTYQSSNFSKECILDALASMLGKSLISNLTGSIVDWINNDFEGGPAFVTDPAGFFVNIADETAGNFIETQLGPIGQLLCSPFDLRLRLNLWLSTGASRKQYIGCRLTDIQKGAYEAFTNGGFIANGGWNTFNALTSDPRNNQYGAFLYASDALNTEFIKKANEKLRELSEGRGFLSFRKCTDWSEGPNAGTGEDSKKTCLKYKVETPGSLINSQLENVFGSELRQFELADEINEVFQALVNAGLRQVFAKGGGGLLGISAKSAGQQSSAAERLRNQDFSGIYNLAQNDTATTNTFNGALSATTKDDLTLKGVSAAVENAKNTSTQTIQQEKNLAQNKPATQSSDYISRGEGGYAFTQAARLAVDTLTDGSYSAAETASELYPWWEVDLGKEQGIATVELYIDPKYPVTGCLVLSNAELPDTSQSCANKIAIPAPDRRNKITVAVNGSARFVRVQHNGNTNLFLYEVKVFAQDNVNKDSASTLSGVTLETPPASIGPIVAPISQETTTPKATFTVGQAFSGKVRVSLRKKDTGSGVWKPYAFGQDFSSFTATASGMRPGSNPQQKFSEPFVNETVRTDTNAAINQPTPYTLASNLNASGGTTITITYSFTPDTGARGGQYELTTEFLDSGLHLVAGGSYIVAFSVAQ